MRSSVALAILLAAASWVAGFALGYDEGVIKVANDMQAGGLACRHVTGGGGA